MRRGNRTQAVARAGLHYAAGDQPIGAPAVAQMTLLGFDYGARRIGVAVGQTVTHTASPLASIRVLDREPDWTVLARLVREHDPSVFVVGLPVTADGTNHPLRKPVLSFSKQLQVRYRLPVYLIDERLSSHEASSRVRGGDDLDATAAQVILETWLNENRAQRRG